MLGSTLLLTLATLAGLVAGFGREWLLIADWGAGAKTDAFLVAMFLPEAIRVMLAGGLLSAAMLPLWQRADTQIQPRWLSGQIAHWLAAGLGLALAIAAAAPLLIGWIGPGLAAADRERGTEVLIWLAFTIPGFLTQAVLTVPLQAAGRFLLSGLGSLLFNLPPVVYLGWAGKQADEIWLAQSFLVGSALMALVLFPSAWGFGWRPWLAGAKGEFAQVWRQLWPLLLSSGASQGLALLERLTASLLGEGSVTLVNLARKLVNIPLIALMGLNQVLLGKMSGEGEQSRLRLMQRGLSICTRLTLLPVAGLMLISPLLVAKLLPAGLSQGPLPLLLALFALSIVFGSWNALLARYFYAGADTRTPLLCELSGSGVQAVLLLALPAYLGIWGLPAAVMGGVFSTGVLLAGKVSNGLWRRLAKLSLLALLVCGACLFTLFQLYPALAATL
ncbi:lipid II flippase MurJ [Methylomonas sp. MED-D]|uniref:lipid II flippase MurJ n=1 Tax=unclassified Methylomonas TaxID=2608980 RepID=UPI0028A47E61|nr:lipid II flippase MurJ [Methylomonas sp. MV1]MDT4330998.1 lipid II flippase MurJ [Methylomonas sp. MV1]